MNAAPENPQAVEAAATGPPDRTLIHTWVRVSDFGAYIASLRQRFREIPGDLTTGIGYVYIDHTCGISLKIERLCRDEPRQQGSSAMISLEDLVSLRLRYGAMNLLDLKPIPMEEANRLGLPGTPAWLHNYESPDLRTIRELIWVDPFRARGFFDDVITILPGIGKNVPELVWVRLEKYLPEIDRFHGILLNEPFRDYGIHRNDFLEILPARGPGGMQLVVLPRKRFKGDKKEGGGDPGSFHTTAPAQGQNRS
jgi:hypothetical protein